MEQVIPMEMTKIFLVSEPAYFLLEIVLRVLVIYIFASVLLGFMGKRGRREISPFKLMFTRNLDTDNSISVY